MAKDRPVATRMDATTLKELKRLFPKVSPSKILRILAEERTAIQRNTDNLYAARKALSGTKSNRNLL